MFLGRGNCVICHSGPAFSNGEFHDTGLPFFTATGRPDPGRGEGIRQVQANPWNRLSPHSDDVTGASAFAVRHVERQHRNWGEFKTPSLRSLLHTAHYMHNGSLATPDRKSVVKGKSVSVRVDLGGGRIIKTKKHIRIKQILACKE